MPVPQAEALVLPGTVERANSQKPHAEYANTLKSCAHALAFGGDNIFPKASTVCCNPDYTVEIYQISACQERASSKRILIMSADPTLRPLCMASEMRSALQNYEFLHSFQILLIKMLRKNR